MNPISARRPLTEVMKPRLSAEALNLIKEGTPQPQTQNGGALTPLAPKPLEVPTAKLAAEPIPTQKPKTPKDTALETVSLVSVSLRLPSEIHDALLKGSSDRKLKKLQPFTQQDIVAEALSKWLQQKGYLS